MNIQRILLRYAMGVLLTGLMVVAAWGHAGEVHTEAPAPKSPLERLTSVFTGSNESQNAPVNPVGIMQTVTGGPEGKSQTQVITLFTPGRIRLGLTEPVRVALTDVTGTPMPVEGYSPEMAIRFPSGKEVSAKLKSVNGTPGLYELAVPWEEAGEATVTLMLGKGSAALVHLEQPIYVKRPPVPLVPFLIVGLLTTGILGAILGRFLKLPAIVWSLALLLGLGGAILVRLPLASAAGQIESAETAYLAQAQAAADQPWPSALPETPAETPAESEPGAKPELPLQPQLTNSGASGRPILGTLIIPDDARAVVSAPQGGTLTSAVVLPRGTTVTQGQVLAELRVLNTEIAPDAAESPGAIAEAKSHVSAAESAVAQAQRDADRGVRLYAAEAISKRELEERQAVLATAQSDLKAAREVLKATEARGRSLRAAGGSGAYRTIRLTSPLDGVITEVAIAAGEYVEPGTPLYTIVTPGRLWIEARLFEDQLLGLEPGTRISFSTSLSSAQLYSARLMNLGLSLDPDTRTLPALFEVTAPPNSLYAGQQVSFLPPTAAGSEGKG
ncbi:MAG: hypothetical protein GEEBNDBF_02711 [bacterium]|nr:hypothetical protein [bacterium]